MNENRKHKKGKPMKKLKEAIIAFADKLTKAFIETMKPERIQVFPPFEIPMTLRRIHERLDGFDGSCESVERVVGIEWKRSFDSFAEAAEFVRVTVAELAAEHGETPIVRIVDNEVTLYFGVEMPHVVTEGDFDLAEAIHRARPQTEAEKS